MNHQSGFNRRQFLALAGAVGCLASRGRALAGADPDPFLLDKMNRDHIPGLAAAVVKNGVIAWSKGFGWSDIDRRIPMTPDTIQNIGSVSKTFTTTALMQLWESGRFRLDDPVNDYLPFEIVHPAYPETSITFRMLMSHRASIDDGPAYAEAYACGDPGISLEDWIKSYLTARGSLYDARRNFHDWPPGKGFSYCNVGFGVLAYLTECIAGVPFADYCRTHIFEPLEMRATSWYLRDLDLSRHAVPYSWVANGEVRGPSWGGIPLGVIGRAADAPLVHEGYAANCLYNHPNYPDGFLRSSVHELCRYVIAYLDGGSYAGRRLLQERTVRELFHVEAQDDKRAMGLTWNAWLRNGRPLLWGHAGSDPGVNADVRLRFEDRVGAVVLMNTDGVSPHEVTEYLLDQVGNF